MRSPSFGSLIPSKEKIKKRQVIGEMEGRGAGKKQTKSILHSICLAQ